LSRLKEEYELTKKKKEALGDLLNARKISQSTYSLFKREIDDAVEEIEGQRKALLEKMASKAMELEERIRALEIILANFEIQHVAGEVDDDAYRRETALICTGLETARKELDSVENWMNRLSSDYQTTPQETEPPQTPSPELEVKLPEGPPSAIEQEQTEAKETVAEATQCKEKSSSLENG
jgi:hypothetical protein